jgi:predicted ribosomally synthesized peptide with SipW-like signal peptide
MSTARKLLLTVLVIGIVGALAGVGTFSAFSATTVNSGNDFAAGTVYITDNDSGSAMYNVSNQAPGDVVERCITVTYTGSLDADVKLYGSAVGALGNYVDLQIEKGTGAVPFGAGCVGFSSDGVVYNDTLGNFASTHTGWANGLVVNPGAATEWQQNDAVVFRFTLTLQDDNNANGGAAALSTGAHSYTWEAQNN